MKVEIFGSRRETVPTAYLKLVTGPSGVTVQLVDEEGEKIKNLILFKHDGTVIRYAHAENSYFATENGKVVIS